MALHIQLVSPVTPKVLLGNILEQIDNGVIDTWEIDSDGDLTHTPYQWKGEAWFRYRPNESELIFGIVARRDKKNVESYLWIISWQILRNAVDTF